MIRDARQLKATIQQLTKGDSLKSKIYLRNFFKERKKGCLLLCDKVLS